MINNLLNNYEFMLCTFVFIPIALTLLSTYRIFCKNYGQAINKPLWRKIVEAFIGLLFFAFILACQLYYGVKENNIKSILISMAASLVVGLLFIGIEYSISRIKKKNHESSNNGLYKTETDESQDNDDGSEIERLGNKKTVDYVRAVLSELSIGIAICYFIVVVILVVLNQFVAINTLEFILSPWNCVLVVVSTFAFLSYTHTIVISIYSNDNLSSDASVDKIKKRLIG